MSDTTLVRIAKLIVTKAAAAAAHDEKVLGELPEVEIERYLRRAANSLTTAETKIWISEEIGHA